MRIRCSKAFCLLTVQFLQWYVGLGVNPLKSSWHTLHLNSLLVSCFFSLSLSSYLLSLSCLSVSLQPPLSLPLPSLSISISFFLSLSLSLSPCPSILFFLPSLLPAFLFLPTSLFLCPSSLFLDLTFSLSFSFSLPSLLSLSFSLSFSFFSPLPSLSRSQMLSINCTSAWHSVSQERSRHLHVCTRLDSCRERHTQVLPSRWLGRHWAEV